MKPTWGVRFSSPARHQERRSQAQHRHQSDNRMASDRPQIRHRYSTMIRANSPRQYLKPAMEAMANFGKHRLRNSIPAVRPSRIKKVATTAEMSSVYVKGELDPKSPYKRHAGRAGLGGVPRCVYCVF